MKKIYCKNCIHRGWINIIDDIRIRRCWREKKRNYDGVRLSSLDCSKENENCDCVYYKRKWWKIFA